MPVLFSIMLLINHTSCQYTTLYYTADWSPPSIAIDIVLTLRIWACHCSFLLLQNYRGNTIIVQHNEQRSNSGDGIHGGSRSSIKCWGLGKVLFKMPPASIRDRLSRSLSEVHHL